MPIPFSDDAMISWLKTQVRILEAWRESAASSPTIDMRVAMSLENHYQWLTQQVERLTLQQPTHLQAVAS